MSAIPVLDAYQELLDDISEIVDSARSALVDAYRKIGQRIVEVEQNGQIRSRYGSGLLQQLSEDLTRRYGLGFSKRNLERMRLFYPGFCISKIRPERKRGAAWPNSTRVWPALSCDRQCLSRINPRDPLGRRGQGNP